MAEFEASLFSGAIAEQERLLAFGFVSEGADYWYRTPILDGQFEAHIRISPSGQLRGQLIDVDLGEDYTAFRIQAQQGPFVNQVRDAYRQVLLEIRAACFKTSSLISQQGQELAEQLKATYGDQPSQPFAKHPQFHAFRHPANQKWYALAMVLERGKLDLAGEDWSAKERQQAVEVLNIKVEPDQLSQLLTLPSIYPSYHMNKKHWVTLVLDEHLTSAQLLSLVQTSRQLVAPKPKMKK